eukprot:Sdes_comp17174_c0_seq1m6339
MMENENPSENPAKDPKASFYEKVLNIRNDILSGKIQPTKEEHEAMSNCYENVILQTGIGAGLFFIASNTFIRQKQMKPSTKGALLTISGLFGAYIGAVSGFSKCVTSIMSLDSPIGLQLRELYNQVSPKKYIKNPKTHTKGSYEDFASEIPENPFEKAPSKPIYTTGKNFESRKEEEEEFNFEKKSLDDFQQKEKDFSSPPKKFNKFGDPID